MARTCGFSIRSQNTTLNHYKDYVVLGLTLIALHCLPVHEARPDYGGCLRSAKGWFGTNEHDHFGRCLLCELDDRSLDAGNM